MGGADAGKGRFQASESGGKPGSTGAGWRERKEGLAVYCQAMNGTARVTKEQIKSEIDKVRDEYLDVLYRIVRTLEEPALPAPREGAEVAWSQFIAEMYGATADAPLQRWPEGFPEERLPLE
jgi:hypothetical protein